MNKTKISSKKTLLGITLSILLIVIFATLFVAMPAVASDFKQGNARITVFEMPELDIQKTYTYNTTVDHFLPYRIGMDAVLYWGEKAEIAEKEYYASNLSKDNGGEVQYLDLDVENENITLKRIDDRFGHITFMNLTFESEYLFIDYPLSVGKTWEIDEVNYTGIVMGSGYVEGTTRGLASVIGEEDILVPAGIARCLILETTMNSSRIVGEEIKWRNTSQRIWLMENGFFAKRQLYHPGIFVEELELKKPILAIVDVKPETLNFMSKGLFTAFIELPEGYDVADINISTVECEGALAIDGNAANDILIVKFNVQDIEDVPTGNTVMLTVIGELDDGIPFEGWVTIRVIET